MEDAPKTKISGSEIEPFDDFNGVKLKKKMVLHLKNKKIG